MKFYNGMKIYGLFCIYLIVKVEYLVIWGYMYIYCRYLVI